MTIRNRSGSKKQGTPARRPLRTVLQVEMLEDRLTPAVATPSQNFVSQAYLDLLTRQVDPGGLASWSKLIDSGVSRTQVVIGILGSPEYLTKEQINPLYEKMLKREPDAGGLAFNLHNLQAGGKLEQVVIGILGSPEYLAIHGGTNDGWLDGAYADLSLGNPAGKVDAGGRAGWDAAFAMGATRQQVAGLLVNGLQYEQNAVSSFYLNFLHRSAETSGLNGWVGVEQGAGELFVLANIVGSQEYFARAQTNPQTPFPTISALSTTTGAVGSSVVVTGTFLNNTTGLTIAGDTIPTSSFTVDSATQITATIPSGAAAGTGPVTVTTPFGPASSASSFTIGPAITSFTPSSGPQGTTPVTVTGTNFTGATAVTIDGLSSGFTVNSDTTITTTVPTGGTPGSSGPITVTTAFGTAISLTNYTLSPPGAPSFKVSPASGQAGDVVTLNGTSLFGVTSVTFNGVSASIVAGSNTSTSVQVNVPASTNGNIVVTTTQGNSGSAFFSYPATVTSFDVSSAKFGQTVTITGTNFLGATGVSFNGTAAATFSVVNNTTITATVPTNATTGPVVVTTGAGASSPSATLTIVPPPTISANPGGNNETAIVKIMGTNLSGATVTFGGTTANVTPISSSEVDFTLISIASVVRSSLPGGGSFSFTVTTAGGSANGTFIFNGEQDGDNFNDGDDIVSFP